MTETLKERIKYIRIYFKFKSRNDMAETLGIESLRLQNLEVGRAKTLLIEEAILFKTVLKINPWWVMSGQGTMLLSDESELETLYTNTEYKIKVISPDELEKKYFCLDKACLSEFEEHSSQLRALKILGDGMSPSLNEGDYVIVNANKKLGTNGIYAYLNEEKFEINRIAVRTGQTIEISYDNPAYKSYSVHKNDIDILGKVILVIARR